MNPAAAPKYGFQVGQLHKAAGGPDRWYLDLENLVWAVRSQPIPFPLVTISPGGSLGILDQPGTRVLFGDKIDYGSYINAGRLTLGIWDKERVWGYEAVGFITENKSEIHSFSQTSDSTQALARPVIASFFDGADAQPSSILVSLPGAFGGTVEVNGHIYMAGAEFNFLKNLIYCDRFKMNLLFGVRYLNLEERLTISSLTLLQTSDPFDPTSSFIQDQFITRNQFGGGQIGFQTELRRGRWFTDIIGKIAAGNMNEEVVIQGRTDRRVTGVTTSIPAGVFAVSSNSGKTEDNEFAYIPEATVKFGYQWTQRISTYIGGNAMYISRVNRPGDQIDPVVNPTLVPVSDQFGTNFGFPRPLRQDNHADFWVAGATFGLSIRY